MKQTAGNTAILVLVALLAACTRVGHIQQTEPIRTLKFTGSHKAVAQCIQQRLGARVQDDSFGEKYVLYDSAKNRQAEGLTHYSITVGRSGPDQGFAEWRIVGPTRGPDRMGGGPARQGLSDAVVQEFWKPVEDCAARAKELSSLRNP
jgi:hypothetical protein